MNTLGLHVPPPTIAQLRARAASGLRGCIAAREQLKARITEQLRQEVNQGRAG